ncbi:hypothetical protein AKJ51_01060 [candidate division MSBL1 archaeon SCGC-AAA382A20]|uniref:Uncharacterized protein n=1 Tax=candidate division MSBL1 archaeon SCGC-AAA382A20 TaxID=1698280 RepID=A0A133VM87_9EURY|nr:hypothetical protein AKJ51_01060 [candidate division MSBL1 archaeon SCGC-AAA382A20]
MQESPGLAIYCIAGPLFLPTIIIQKEEDMKTIKRRFAYLFLLCILPLTLLAGCDEKQEQTGNNSKDDSQAKTEALEDISNMAQRQHNRAEGLEEDLSVATALAYSTGFVAILFVALLARERSAKKAIQKILHLKTKEDKDGKNHN